MKGIDVNDSAELEREADIMGKNMITQNNVFAGANLRKQHVDNKHSYVQGWWPKGHKLITELAFKKGNLENHFDEPSRKYLIDRSPDIDFFQDNFETMSEGQKQTKPYFKIYQQYIESESDELKQQAREMYENGELNKRRPGFLLMHGEGGAYNSKNAKSKNESFTAMLVDKAISQWSSDRGKSLSTLSDALHQAADRGSHGEGHEFQGHDSRIQMGVKGKGNIPGIGKQPWEQQPWELPLGGKLDNEEWQPDNFAVNKDGATLGIYFVVGALCKFLKAVGGPISMGDDQKAEKRKLAFGPISTASNSNLSKMLGKSGGGKGKLTNVSEHSTTRLFSQVIGAINDPKLNPAEGDVEHLVQGSAFYEGEVASKDMYEKALVEFRKNKKNKASVETSQEYYYQEMGKDDGIDKVLKAKYITSAYKKVYGNQLAVNVPSVETGNADKRVEIYDKAVEIFKQWNKSVILGGYSAEKRKDEAKKYYNLEVLKQKNDEDRNLCAATIRIAYKSVFKEEIF